MAESQQERATNGTIEHTAAKSLIGPPIRPASKQRGRPKGAKNRLTVDMRNAIYQAFVRAGGVDYLEELARKDHKTFCSLLAKIVPSQLSATLDTRVSSIDIHIIES